MGTSEHFRLYLCTYVFIGQFMVHLDKVGRSPCV
jgi:hypothetical protein